MKTEKIALVQGWDDTAVDAAALERAPGACRLRAWTLRRARGRRPAAAGDVRRRQALDARPHPAVLRRARVPGDARRLRLRAVPQLARARPARARVRRRASSPGRRCRRSRRATPASGARSTRAPSRSRSASSSPRPLFSLRPRPTCSAAPPPRSPTSSASRRRCCCSALSLHALPELIALFLPLAAWTIASRRRRVGGAARGDLRDRRHRGPPILVAAAAVEVVGQPPARVARACR